MASRMLGAQDTLDDAREVQELNEQIMQLHTTERKLKAEVRCVLLISKSELLLTCIRRSAVGGLDRGIPIISCFAGKAVSSDSKTSAE